MTQNKHTPGPWHLLTNVDGSPIYPISIEDAEGYVVCSGISPFGLSNARLIAAAPDLLEACRALLDEAPRIHMSNDIRDGGYHEMRDNDPDCPWCRTRTAIAKATGADREEP